MLCLFILFDVLLQHRLHRLRIIKLPHQLFGGVGVERVLFGVAQVAHAFPQKDKESFISCAYLRDAEKA